MNKEDTYQDKLDRLQQNIASVYEELRVLTARLESLQKEHDEEKPQEKLHAVVDHQSYCISFYYKKRFLGYIDHEGRCKILNVDGEIEVYNQWREENMPIDTDSIIEWRGGKYGFNKFFEFERKDIEDGEIYDFDDCYHMSNCKDNNIKRHGHNNRPIGY